MSLRTSASGQATLYRLILKFNLGFFASITLSSGSVTTPAVQRRSTSDQDKLRATATDSVTQPSILYIDIPTMHGLADMPNADICRYHKPESYPLD
ncbi:predicted protein [Plenodomus lingam JN3]|uniref:Predicted protein n=1 Tax=Leptosphaeria maculans (strain JN3 / isolate v23.1.3 / race Av1-4-5-6-7-8) TaxID=985895 RepID=E4ZLU1_LEPMJ|nr:predicted protein [Plenodomus lingam JN3]CBX92771.1 predicted protein [Plenodomus lingam JN3]